MEDGSADDHRYLIEQYDRHTGAGLVDNVIGMLGLLEGPTLGYRIDRYQHSLQSATRALRNDERLDLVVGALLHDVADGFAPANHSSAAAAIVAPYLDDETTWIVEHHGLFQGYYYFHHVGGDRDARDRYADSPHYDACVDFCANYDQNCFDPDYDTLPIEEFRPMLDEVFARPSRLVAVPPLGAADIESEVGR